MSDDPLKRTPMAELDRDNRLTKMQKVGRLALRVEGEWWVARYALPNTMDDAIEIGRVRIGVVTKNDHYKQAFQDLMWAVVADFLEEKTGTRPTGEVEDAPESERAGRA